MAVVSPVYMSPSLVKSGVSNGMKSIVIEAAARRLITEDGDRSKALYAT